ncbi:hypothetical protein TruAng_001912 [Truncatella angustata]|nr:hypothetical protein TruAng_001912 [Truncatella angustata]
MADTKPPVAPAAASAAAAATSAAANYKAAPPNPALQMMGFGMLPKKLPSRNWLIFWAITGSFSAAIIYDKREKKRATARWSRAVSHLAKEPVHSPTQLPRKLTILLESPPNDGLRVAQDHFTEYMKPILAASGLDWEFIQGRKEGDVRAAVAEKIRRTRRLQEGVISDEGQEPTGEEIVKDIRERNATPEWAGINGDIVVGRHTWKEYIRGLHEGWLGPLTAPPVPEVAKLEKPVESSDGTEETKEGEKKEEEKTEEEKKPERPPQPLPYNTTNDYDTSSLPRQIPSEFSPSVPIAFPHLLGFTNTFIRLGRFLNRRHLADEVGREVAAVCLGHAREYREDAVGEEPELKAVLEHEEKDWHKSVWKEEKPKEGEVAGATPAPEKIWISPIVVDSRLSQRMRRFELSPEDEARAREIVVPEEDVEGWLKGSFRSLYRWAVSPAPPRMYSSDDDE